jgi:hypothetical protein
MKIDGTIFQKVFVPDTPEFLEKLEGKRVTLKVISGKRSNQQNRYYHGVVLPIIANEVGWSVSDAHDLLKDRFLSKPQELKKDKKTFYLSRVASTKDLNTKQMEAYLKRVRDFAGEFLGVFIPLPNEKDLY